MSPERSFVGRQRELALLGERYETAAGGQAGVVLVTGEPGIGKTCLLRETAARAARTGATVLWGDASEADGMPPTCLSSKPSVPTSTLRPLMNYGRRPTGASAS
jgi:Mrp family chromosome partitioning ATPase